METPNFKKTKFDIKNESPRASKPKKMFNKGEESKIPKLSPKNQNTAEVS
jgi:hypothetical protein